MIHSSISHLFPKICHNTIDTCWFTTNSQAKHNICFFLSFKNYVTAGYYNCFCKNSVFFFTELEEKFTVFFTLIFPKFNFLNAAMILPNLTQELLIKPACSVWFFWVPVSD